MTLEQMVCKLADFGDDIAGGAKYVKDHFDEMPEPDRSHMFTMLVAEEDQFPQDVWDMLAMLAFKCELGRKRMRANLQRAAADLPDGQLKRDLIG